MQIMYNIYNNSECLFCTYSKEKADKFIEAYNKCNCNESDYYPDKVRLVAFKSSSNIEEIKETELEADRIITNYQYFINLSVEYNKQNNEFILINKDKRYLDRTGTNNYKTVNYNDFGYRLNFVISEENLVINLSYSNTTGKCDKIINQNLISKIQKIEEDLNYSLKGNILYVVFKKDYECPPRLFKTFSKEKAESFVREYNRINSEDDENKVGYFSINLSQIEDDANFVIEEYLTVKKQVYIEVNKDGKSKLLKSEIKYCGEDVEDIINVEEQTFMVTLVLDKDYPVDLNDSLIVNKIKELKEMHSYLFE